MYLIWYTTPKSLFYKLVLLMLKCIFWWLILYSSCRSPLLLTKWSLDSWGSQYFYNFYFSNCECRTFTCYVVSFFCFNKIRLYRSWCTSSSEQKWSPQESEASNQHKVSSKVQQASRTASMLLYCVIIIIIYIIIYNQW